MSATMGLPPPRCPPSPSRCFPQNVREKVKLEFPPPPLLANLLWIGATVGGIQPMSSAIHTAAIVPRIEDVEAPSLKQ